MHQQHRNPVRGTGFVVADIELAGLDLLDRQALGRRTLGQGLRMGGADEGHLGGGDARDRRAQEIPAMVVEFI
ncbi:hypothetical protein QTI27_13275 [Variovorax sp. J31P216]|nr:hypothetical protein [Variovorax sp. J31P216]